MSPEALPLAEWRKRRGYTQESLARMVGVSWSTIASIEGNHHEPTLSLAHKIAAVLLINIGQVQWPLAATVKRFPSKMKKTS